MEEEININTLPRDALRLILEQLTAEERLVCQLWRRLISQKIQNFKCTNEADLVKACACYPNASCVITPTENKQYSSVSEAVSAMPMLKSLKLEYLREGAQTVEHLNLWTNLVELSVIDNRLKDEDISGVSALCQLRVLSLANNQIKCLDALSSLTNLQSLDLSRNDTLWNIKPLSTLTQLTSLCLDYTDVSRNKYWPYLPNLQELNLMNNYIGSSMLASLSSLSTLSKLNLGCNGFTIITALTSLTRLQNLNLFSNVLKDKVSSVMVLTSLQTLNLELTYMTDKEAEALAGLTKLVSLNLRENRLTTVGAKALCRLINLKCLKLGWNFINSEGVEEIINTLKNLRTLELRGNSFKAQELKKEVMHGLMKLDVYWFMAHMEVIRNTLTPELKQKLSKLKNRRKALARIENTFQSRI